MSFEETYARAYDALYRAKNYPAEAKFVSERLATVLGETSFSILDIGCGTGLHDIELARAGHAVTGVDASVDMLNLAIERRAHLAPDIQKLLTFSPGDARNFDLGKTHDAAISLFHVMSYMSGETDFDMALNTARLHLRPGGAFLFDVWYAPAVIAEPPQRRQRDIQHGDSHIRRVTTPYWEKEKNLVRIVFDVIETNVVTGHSTASREEHLMRYFSVTDLESSLSKARFEITEIGEWLSGDVPSERSFGVYALARAV